MINWQITEVTESRLMLKFLQICFILVQYHIRRASHEQDVRFLYNACSNILLKTHTTQLRK